VIDQNEACILTRMGLESKITNGRALEDAVRRKESLEIQAILTELSEGWWGKREGIQAAMRLRDGVMVRKDTHPDGSSSGESHDTDLSGGSSGSSGSRRTLYDLFVGDTCIGTAFGTSWHPGVDPSAAATGDDLLLVKFARLAGRDVLYEKDAEAAAKALAAESVPIRFRVWADFSPHSQLILFEEEGPADVLFARAARAVPDKAKWKKAAYSYSVTPLELPEDTRQNLSDFKDAQIKKPGKYDGQQPGQFDEFLKKLQNPPNLLRLVGNRRHLIDPCLEKIKEREVARVLKRHPELFSES